LLRTHRPRSAGGVLALVMTLVVCLLAGMLTGSAQADDAAPSVESSESAAADPSSPAAPDPQTQDESSPGTVAKLLEGFGGEPTVNGEYLPLKRGLTESVNVAANGDSCGPSAQIGVDCNYSRGTAPAGWGLDVQPNGVLTVWVPGATTPGAYPVTYNLTDTSGSKTTSGTVTVAVTPDDYNPPAGMTFSHPYRKGYRNLIHDHIVRTIDSVPPGQTIRLASWSFSSKTYRNALRAAKARGVKVQIVLSWRNKPKNSDYRRLTRAFGTNVTPDGSWVRKCWHSCRGVGGTMHSKIFLFSQVYRTPYVMVSGSANLTDFAVTNQWNQMNTSTGDKPVYDEAVNVFTQMYFDTPVNPPYVETHFPTLTSYYYPGGRVSPSNDFMLKALAPVQCKGAVNAGKRGRTIVKIAMYAWYQSRGKWLAKRVRQLWQQGCQVQIVYAISSNPVKSILYSPSGRGRIPMRQILLTNTKGIPIYYLHDKWVAITGNYAGVRDNSVSFHGSFNFSDMGFSSDEQFQKLPGRDVYNRFARDFKLLWTDRQARAPSPVSKIPTIEGRYSQDDLRLGTGVYRYMDAD
jgi:hypothetical protein